MRLARQPFRLAGATIAALPALAAGTAFAQSTPATRDATDLVPVVIWTCVASLLALLVVSVGYLYKRERGLDVPLPQPPIPEPGQPAAGEAAHATHGH